MQGAAMLTVLAVAFAISPLGSPVRNQAREQEAAVTDRPASPAWQRLDPAWRDYVWSVSTTGAASLVRVAAQEIGF